jgi:hypothetical protein
MFVRVLALALLMATAVKAQGPGIMAVNNSYQRVLAIVPMIGKGTGDDPIRPMFVPADGFVQNRVANNGANQGRKARAGIISYTYQLTDDGKNAIVEFVSVDREGLRPILESKLGNVTVFERDKAKKADIETAIRGKKKDFDFGKFEHKVR